MCDEFPQPQHNVTYSLLHRLMKRRDVIFIEQFLDCVGNVPGFESFEDSEILLSDDEAVRKQFEKEFVVHKMPSSVRQAYMQNNLNLVDGEDKEVGSADRDSDASSSKSGRSQ